MQGPGIVISPILSGPGWPRNYREMRLYFVYFVVRRQSFSATQTVWRRGRDSNPPDNDKSTTCRDTDGTKVHGKHC